MTLAVQVILLTLVAGAFVYHGLVIVAAVRFCRVRQNRSYRCPPISVLKPLAGEDSTLAANLATFFEQDYPEFELLFGVHTADDPAAAVVSWLQVLYPHVPVRLVVTGMPDEINPKVHSLVRLEREARYQCLVATDSDVSVGSGFLRAMASGFADPKISLITCPYRSAGRSLWPRLEAAGMNTEFLGGVLVARMLEGMRFALGAAIAVRRSALDAIGGFAGLGGYLADDFVLGQRMAESGRGVLLSSYPVEHHLPVQTFLANFRHRLRWARSTRHSRPAGYYGLAFTYPEPWALLYSLLFPQSSSLLYAAILVRIVSAYVVSTATSSGAERLRDSLLAPLQQNISFLAWLAGFFGETISWRGQQYRVGKSGKLLQESPKEDPAPITRAAE